MSTSSPDEAVTSPDEATTSPDEATMSDKEVTMSDTGKSGLISKVIGPKKRWRAYKERARRLPANHRTAVEAIERYLMHFVPTDGDSNQSMFEDLADLFEQAVADGTPIRGIVGEDPVEFADAFAQNYSEGGFVPARERERLTASIEDCTREENHEG
ncbi:DUF1048 domain-containing protein [Streptomyces sp. NPDC000594]|uniref:DUF1048 domain-containing protein n=1 Tax=Streptomyces sp. NPDC000594 TaxID=3154261 RepID=UPI00331F9C0C